MRCHLLRSSLHRKTSWNEKIERIAILHLFDGAVLPYPTDIFKYEDFHICYLFTNSTALSSCGSSFSFTSFSLISTFTSGTIPSRGICLPSGPSQRATVSLSDVSGVI